MLWNRVPSAEERRNLGTEFTGGPYPLEFLGDCGHMKLSVREGDLYIFNGSLVHAVGATHGQRATVSCLIGFRDERNIVMWT